MTPDSLRRWKVTGFIASIVIVLMVPIYALKEEGRRGSGALRLGMAEPTFVGRDACVPCHRQEVEAWRGSDHDLAMAVATDSTVLGDFNDAVFESHGVTTRFYRRDGKFLVHTQGPGGEMGEFEVAYTFGYDPLQQYLIPFPGGRLQSLTVAWDADEGHWFDLHRDAVPPDDWLHWTRNGQNWNGMCAECHSTNLQKGYDPETRTFETTWSEIDVSCEACHGPASRHVAWAEIPPMARPEIDDYGLVVATGGISSRQQVALCAPCHSRRTELGDYDHSGDDLLEVLIPSVLDEGLYYTDGQILEEVYVYGSFLQSKMYRNDVRCTDCHDPHSTRLVMEGNDLCLQCHQADAYDTYDHHFHQKIHEGKPSDGALCVKCHMVEWPYMIIDERADHSFRVPRPDLTEAIGTPNACDRSGCHDDKPLEWSVRHFTEWYGKARRSHYGTTLAAGRRGDPEAGPELARLAGDALYPAIVRATALSLLGTYPVEVGGRAFAVALSDEDPLIRYTAVQHVPAASLRELIDRTAPLLFDPAASVRRQAATRLAAVPRDSLKAYQRDALEEALAEHQRAMEYSLDFAFAGHNLGNLYASLGEPEEAERFYRQALEIDDLFYPAKMNLAILCSQQGRNDEAERLLREVLVGYPDLADAAYSLGLLLAEKGDYAEAAGFLERAAMGMPWVSRTHYNLGLLMQALERDGEAEAALRRALDLEPANLDYLYALADHYLKRGRLEEALPLAERMIAEYPEMTIGHEIKAMIERSTR